MSTAPAPREYRGVLIHRQSYSDGTGIRYWSLGTGTLLRADTLEGMRALIRFEVSR
jgi:hypothetical protein